MAVYQNIHRKLMLNFNIYTYMLENITKNKEMEERNNEEKAICNFFSGFGTNICT